MRIIDFDKQFAGHVTRWMTEYGAKYKHNMDRMEAQMPEVYLRWIEQPADFLEGLSPVQYFDRFADADALVELMLAYEQDKVPVPDLLLERIVALGEPSASRLNRLLDAPDLTPNVQALVISLLRELDSALPMARYIGWIRACERIGEREELAADSLRGMGDAAREPLLAALSGASAVGEELLLDLLADFPGDERVFALALRKFADSQDNRALYAGYLGKLGDERALPALLAAAKAPEVGYLDFIELRSAIEELGGDAPPERDFTGDPSYEALHGKA